MFRYFVNFVRNEILDSENEILAGGGWFYYIFDGGHKQVMSAVHTLRMPSMIKECHKELMDSVSDE